MILFFSLQEVVLPTTLPITHILTAVAAVISSLGVVRFWPAVGQIFVSGSNCKKQLIQHKAQISEIASLFQIYIAFDDVEGNKNKQQAIDQINNTLARIRKENNEGRDK